MNKQIFQLAMMVLCVLRYELQAANAQQLKLRDPFTERVKRGEFDRPRSSEPSKKPGRSKKSHYLSDPTSEEKTNLKTKDFLENMKVILDNFVPKEISETKTKKTSISLEPLKKKDGLEIQIQKPDKLNRTLEISPISFLSVFKNKYFVTLIFLFFILLFDHLLEKRSEPYKRTKKRLFKKINEIMSDLYRRLPKI